MSGDIVERLRRGDWRAFVDERVVGLGCEAADAIEARDAEIVRLRQWKAEATTVIGDWQAVFDSLVAPRVSQFDFGKSTSVLTAKEIVRLSSEVERLTAEVERLRADYAELLVEYGRKHDYACSMDALAEKRLMEITRLRAERDDHKARLAIEAVTAPDADFDTMMDSLQARLRDLHAEVARLHAEVERLRAERDAIDAMHHPVPSGKDDEVCNNCGCFWPCRTHLLLHPEEARRG